MATLDTLKTSLSSRGRLPVYPQNHKVGVKVDKGGSDCEKCEYVSGQKCTNRKWVAWHGSATIPEALDEYCCDFWETKK